MTDPNEREIPDATESEQRVSVRRAPKIPVFLVLGAGLGAIAAYLLTSLFPIDPEVGFGATFGYFALWGVSIGLVIGGGIAVVLDVLSLKRARELAAARESVSTPLEGEIEE
ncbi:hypothetical protein [Desertivibrio insolitus]|uniref:hypothetical protein n=1 Tax=Herbiconiux sp. SYSU D00978 TaxID=2812562 RepID=UPI001A96A8FE|nr:hypothetical protein [Herbiconiux sp. SYSU D00978]